MHVEYLSILVLSRQIWLDKGFQYELECLSIVCNDCEWRGPLNMYQVNDIDLLFCMVDHYSYFIHRNISMRIIQIDLLLAVYVLNK
jgi:hypothetical protein